LFIKAQLSYAVKTSDQENHVLAFHVSKKVLPASIATENVLMLNPDLVGLLPEANTSLGFNLEAIA
jgi:hypothetical protein